jgi:hypothetical protein
VPRLVVVLPLDPLHDGDGFSLRDWPLHLTVAPTFTRIDLPAVVRAITPVLLAQRSFRLRVGQDEGFGRSQKIPVSVVEPSAELTDLHVALLDALRLAGADFDDPEFIGNGYRAHVTMTRRARVSAGDQLTLHQAAIVDMAPEGDQRLRRVVWTMTLTDG